MQIKNTLSIYPQMFHEETTRKSTLAYILGANILFFFLFSNFSFAAYTINEIRDLGLSAKPGIWAYQIETDAFTDKIVGIAKTLSVGDENDTGMLYYQCEGNRACTLGFRFTENLHSDKDSRNTITYRFDNEKSGSQVCWSKGNTCSVLVFNLSYNHDNYDKRALLFLNQMTIRKKLIVKSIDENNSKTKTYTFMLEDFKDALQKSCGWHPSYNSIMGNKIPTVRKHFDWTSYTGEHSFDWEKKGSSYARNIKGNIGKYYGKYTTSPSISVHCSNDKKDDNIKVNLSGIFGLPTSINTIDVSFDSEKFTKYNITHSTSKNATWTTYLAISEDKQLEFIKKITSHNTLKLKTQNSILKEYNDEIISISLKGSRKSIQESCGWHNSLKDLFNKKFTANGAEKIATRFLNKMIKMANQSPPRLRNMILNNTDELHSCAKSYALQSNVPQNGDEAEALGEYLMNSCNYALTSK